MNIYADNRMLSVGLVGGTVSRHAGDMRDLNNQNELYRKLDIPPQRILHFHQTHSDRIISLLSEEEADDFQKKPEQEADAWVLSLSGWGVAIQTADCVPLFLWDEKGGFFALAHCGWKGVVKRLPYLTAQALKKAGAAGTISAWLGPHIQSCCFEVQEDVATQFTPKSVVYKQGKIFVNLNTEISLQLQQAGICATDIKMPYYCTCGDEKNFFSWRRDHIRQNLLSFVYKP